MQLAGGLRCGWHARLVCESAGIALRGGNQVVRARVLNVLLREDAEQITSHGKGPGEQVGRHTIARDEDGRLGEARVLRVEQDGIDLRVGLGLMVGEEDDIVAVGHLQARPDPVEVRSAEGRVKC